MSQVAVVLVTHNRLDYTRKTLARLVSDQREEFDLYLWDNASTDGTQDFLRETMTDARIKDLVLSRENVGQGGAMSAIWSQCKTDLVGKIDNDCLATPGWTSVFARAHVDIPELGVLAMWHFWPEDFDYERARHKIQRFGDHQVFRHPWTCGSGFIMKREVYERFGPWEEGAGTGTTSLFLRIAQAGYVNGWYYPLVWQEHMDDPRSEHSRFRRMSFEEAWKGSYGWQWAGYRGIGMREYQALQRRILGNLMDDPYDPAYYVGPGARLRRLRQRLMDGVSKWWQERVSKRGYTNAE